MSQFDPFDIRNQEQAHAKKAERTKLEVASEIDDLKWLMGNKRGRRIVWRQLELCGVYRSSFNHSGSITAFNEGARNIGLNLLAKINTHCPDQYSVMLKEQTDDRSTDDGRRNTN